jgi:soluble lytic murein transglycosylase-like protein
MARLQLEPIGQRPGRPLVAGVQIACLAAALFVVSVAVPRVTESVFGPGNVVPVPALGAAAHETWESRVDVFAERLERTFRVRSRVAADFSGWILEASKRHDVSPELLAALVFAESSFRKNVVSRAGAIGPAQVQPSWQKFCGAQSLEDPAENIYCGAQILAYLRDVCGDERCALAAYNVGLRNHRESEAHQAAGLRYVRKVERYLAGFDTRQIL